MQALLAQWRITNPDIQPLKDNTWVVNHDLFLKQGHKEIIEHNFTVMTDLGQLGIPVANYIQTSTGNIFGNDAQGNIYTLSARLPGRIIKDIYQEANYSKLALVTGKSTAILHHAFSKLNLENVRKANFLQEMENWIYRSLSQSNWLYITEQEYLECLMPLKTIYNALPSQLIHRDLHYGNLLFNNGQLSGYIDFDLNCKNIRLFDVAYFLAGLLDGHKDKPDDVCKWLEIVTQYVIGYEEVLSLQAIEKKCLKLLMLCIELLFTAYYAKNNNEVQANNAADFFRFMNELYFPDIS